MTNDVYLFVVGLSRLAFTSSRAVLALWLKARLADVLSERVLLELRAGTTTATHNDLIFLPRNG